MYAIMLTKGIVMYFRRKCKITFICHGATIYSEEMRFSDADNYPPLSELGVSEIDAMTNYLRARGVKNDGIYTSPSVRTIQSAMIISKAFKTEYKVLEDLKPRKNGLLNGLTLEQILKKYPKYPDILENPENKLGDLETTSDFIARIKTSIDALVEENIGNRIIVVTHPDIIQAVICSVLNIPADRFSQIYIRTGSATQITYFEGWESLVYSGYLPLS